MGMSSNLPPGVTPSMIPGNRPEDMEEEAFWQLFETKIDEAKVPVPKYGWDDAIQQAIIIARDLGYEKGYGDAKADAEMEATYDAERREEGSV